MDGVYYMVNAVTGSRINSKQHFALRIGASIKFAGTDSTPSKPTGDEPVTSPEEGHGKRGILGWPWFRRSKTETGASNQADQAAEESAQPKPDPEAIQRQIAENEPRIASLRQAIETSNPKVIDGDTNLGTLLYVYAKTKTFPNGASQELKNAVIMLYRLAKRLESYYKAYHASTYQREGLYADEILGFLGIPCLKEDGQTADTGTFTFGQPEIQQKSKHGNDDMLYCYTGYILEAAERSKGATEPSKTDRAQEEKFDPYFDRNLRASIPDYIRVVRQMIKRETFSQTDHTQYWIFPPAPKKKAPATLPAQK